MSSRFLISDFVLLGLVTGPALMPEVFMSIQFLVELEFLGAMNLTLQEIQKYSGRALCG